MKRLFVVVLVLLLPAPTFAQETHIGASTQISTSRNLGYLNPNIGGGLDGAYRRDKFVILAEANLIRARKIETGDGRAYTAAIGGRWQPLGKVFLGGGAELHYQQTSQWKKTNVVPYGEIGFNNHSRFIASGAYFFPTDDKNSDVIRLRADVYHPIHKANQVFLRVGASFLLARFENADLAFSGFRSAAYFGVEKRF